MLGAYPSPVVRFKCTIWWCYCLHFEGDGSGGGVQSLKQARNLCSRWSFCALESSFLSSLQAEFKISLRPPLGPCRCFNLDLVIWFFSVLELLVFLPGAPCLSLDLCFFFSVLWYFCLACYFISLLAHLELLQVHHLPLHTRPLSTCTSAHTFISASSLLSRWRDRAK